MKINNREERQKFLEANIKGMGSYALVTYNNYTEVIWISNMGTSFGNDNSIWFLEAPCEVHQHNYNLNNKRELKFVKRNGYLIKGNNVYEIDCPQVAPFLPDELDDLILISEEYCLEWILNKNS